MNRIYKILSITITLGIFSACGNDVNQDQAEETTVDTMVVDTISMKADTATVQSALKGEEVSYKADTTTMKGYMVYDPKLNGKRPGILVVHEWWGLNDYVRHRADMLAELGYVALAVDMYGNGKQAEHPDDAKKFSGMVMKNMPAAESRFDAAYKLLASNPMVSPTDISAIGYCFGGSVVLTMANSGIPLDGVAAFHSGVETPIKPGKNLKAKVLVQNGEEDPFVSPESVKAFKTKMDELKAPYEYVVYPNAVHAYTNPDATEMGKKFDLPLAYNENADTLSWNKLKEFLSALYPNKQ